MSYVPVRVTMYRHDSANRRWQAMLHEFHRAMRLFYRKHYASGWRASLAPAVWLGIRLRDGLVLGLNAARGRQVVSP